MGKKLKTESVPCPSCGGTVRTTGTSEESEWTTCPHCKYEWACPPPHKPKATPKKPERRQVRLKRRFRALLFTVGLVLATTSIAICFEPERFPETGGIDVNPKAWIVFTCAVACYSASRPWRWFGFSVLLLAAARYGTGTTGEWLIVCVGTLCGLLLREPTLIERDMVIKFNDPDIGVLVIDGIFDEHYRFTDCEMRWHGKGDDWDTALKEAKKGLDLSKVNRNWKAAK
jgi:hypothetical protein